MADELLTAELDILREQAEPHTTLSPLANVNVPQTLYSSHLAAIGANITLLITNATEVVLLIIQNKSWSAMDEGTKWVAGIDAVIVVLSFFFIIWAGVGILKENKYAIQRKKPHPRFLKQYFPHYYDDDPTNDVDENDQLVTDLNNMKISVNDAVCFRPRIALMGKFFQDIFTWYFSTSLVFLYILTILLIIADAVGDGINSSL
jgi:hypothetical protein